MLAFKIMSIGGGALGSFCLTTIRNLFLGKVGNLTCVYAKGKLTQLKLSSFLLFLSNSSKALCRLEKTGGSILTLPSALALDINFIAHMSGVQLDS